MLERRAVIHQDDRKNSAVVLDDGIVSRHRSSASAKDESDMTVQELLAHEKTATSTAADQEARNVLRRGKKKRHFKEAVDSDEEEERQLVNVGLRSGGETSGGEATAKSARRDRARQIARHDRQEQITARCWWWLESSRFDRRTLLALGDHASLVMAPAPLSVVPGRHFYLVPVPHAPSLTACDENVWHELRRFQDGLRSMAAAQQQEVLFFETVLPTSSSGFWQTRLEAVMVPRTVGADAPLYFKTALTEQAEEWGTHQKLMKTGNGKDLRATVPKNFHYFYIEYGPNGQGYVQMIESRAFPKDFGADTVLGMMHRDPMRFRSGKPASKEEERRIILQFLEKWKPYDWTVELDEEKK